jgi:CDGSH-type Zn-finger protein
MPSSNAERKIVITPNGPYLVSGSVPLAEQAICTDAEGQCHGWREGQEYPVQERVALCRCGQSQHKPFCDGTHRTAHFDGAETASREPYAERATETQGSDLKLTDVEELCAGARFCHRAGGTWALTVRSRSPEARQAAIEEACECPSGRLVACEKDGTPIEPQFEPSIGLVEDVQAGVQGPLWVRGGIPVESADGTCYEVRNRVTLCRCGKSANKPFCDGSHLE